VILERELTSINLPGTLVIPSGAAPIPPDRPAAYAARPRADAVEAPIFA
jgi:hypothetical protein